MKWKFGSAPAVGLTLDGEGQSFVLLALSPHIKLDGSETMLAEWVSACADCGAAFTARTGMLAFPEIRRCADHRQAGVRVKKDH